MSLSIENLSTDPEIINLPGATTVSYKIVTEGRLVNIRYELRDEHDIVFRDEKGSKLAADSADVLNSKRINRPLAFKRAASGHPVVSGTFLVVLRIETYVNGVRVRRQKSFDLSIR